jgi:biotin carboxylase
VAEQPNFGGAITVHSTMRTGTPVIAVRPDAIAAEASPGAAADGTPAALPSAFAENGNITTDAPVRVVIAKPGLDGHDRGAKAITRKIAQRAGAPLVPGTAGPVSGTDEVPAFVEAHGPAGRHQGGSLSSRPKR